MTTKLILDDTDRAQLLEVLALASTKYHALEGYALDKGHDSMAVHYKMNKIFCDDLSDQIINRIGRCEQ